MRLIDADAMRKELVETLKLCDAWMVDAKDDETKVIAQANWFAFLEAKLRLDSAPTIDAVPVVRCKDCKWKADTIGESWCDFHEFTILSDDDFCSYGERRDDGED